MTCVDCGTRGYIPSKSRGDVCAACMEMRSQLIEAMTDGKITHEQFVIVQNGCGPRRRNIEALLKKVGVLTKEVRPRS